MVAEPVPATAGPPEPPPYPVRISIERQDRQSRLTNLPLGIGSFIRYILAIPNLIVWYFLGLASQVVFLVATFAILFTGRYPQGLYNFVVGVNRWLLGLTAYVLHLNDAYPAFSMDAGKYPATYEADYPEQLSRLLNFPFLGMFIKGVLAIPHLVVLYLVYLVAFVLLFVAQFAILFTGSFPAGMHDFVVGAVRWQARVNAYIIAMTDRYPPFSLK